MVKLVLEKHTLFLAIQVQKKELSIVLLKKFSNRINKNNYLSKGQLVFMKFTMNRLMTF